MGAGSQKDYLAVLKTIWDRKKVSIYSDFNKAQL